jgi:hypothetical protein
MGYLRYGRTVKIIPHLLHLHLAKTGVSLSVGKPLFTVNFGRRGANLSSSLRGFGLSYRTQLESAADMPRKQSPELGWEYLLAILIIFTGAFFILAAIWKE